MIYIFDLGGVIIKPKNFERIYKKLNIDIEYEGFMKIWYNEDAMKSYKGLVNENKVFQDIINKLKINLSVKELLEIIYSEREYYGDTLEILNRLKRNNNKIYLLSNLRKIDFYYLKKDIDISIFDGLFLSYELRMAKPNKEIYYEVIKEINCNAEDIYYFDNNIKNVENAKKCGINAFCVDGHNLKELLNKDLKCIM